MIGQLTNHVCWMPSWVGAGGRPTVLGPIHWEYVTVWGPAALVPIADWATHQMQAC